MINYFMKRLNETDISLLTLFRMVFYGASLGSKGQDGEGKGFHSI